VPPIPWPHLESALNSRIKGLPHVLYHEPRFPLTLRHLFTTYVHTGGDVKGSAKLLLELACVLAGCCPMVSKKKCVYVYISYEPC